MASVYADRAFLSVNGVPVIDLQSASLKQNFNSKPVDTMTNDSFNRGYVAGNRHIDLMLQVAVENTLATPKIESLPFATADVQATFVQGADQYTATGLFIKDSDQSAPGVGQEGKKTWNLGATKVVDAVGNSILFDITL